MGIVTALGLSGSPAAVHAGGAPPGGAFNPNDPVAAIGDEPSYLAGMYPQFVTQGGMSEISADLAPLGLPGFRPLARFMNHQHGSDLIMYFLPRAVPDDPAIAERVLSDVLMGQVVDMHWSLGVFPPPRGSGPRDLEESRALRSTRPLVFGAAR